MKILDKYVAKNFLVGYAIVFMVLMGLITIVDLFVNLDEFAESSELGSMEVFNRVLTYYSAQSALYFRECAGFITVIAAVFSLGRMTKNNELIAIMASGVSLKRVIAPIIVLAVILIGLLIVDQEFIIPRLANKLVKSHDAIGGGEKYAVWFMKDSQGTLICTKEYDEDNKKMLAPAFILRRQTQTDKWETYGLIKADYATYDYDNKRWILTNGRRIDTRIDASEDSEMSYKPTPTPFYETDLSPDVVPLKRQEGYLDLLSLSQLTDLENVSGTKIKDLAALIAQKQNRITEPIINIIMLLIALPVLVCRGPKTMKSAIVKSFAITASCFVVSNVCKMMATEVFFNQIKPELWAWLPVIIFLPIAFIEIDSMKT